MSSPRSPRVTSPRAPVEEEIPLPSPSEYKRFDTSQFDDTEEFVNSPTSLEGTDEASMAGELHRVEGSRPKKKVVPKKKTWCQLLWVQQIFLMVF